jgi:iron complex transport system permease protein
MLKPKYRIWLFITILALIITLLVVGLALSTGEMNIKLTNISSILLSGKGSVEYSIVTQIRLPRILLGLAIGGSLSLAGVILQGIYRNPLVEPYTLGISGGAAIGVAIAIVFGLYIKIGTLALPFSGFIGALVTTILVYFLSTKQGKLQINKMVLIGVMVSFIASSAMMFMLSTTNTENLQGIIFWTMGSLDEPNPFLIKACYIIAVICLIASYLFTQPLNALRLGEEKARHIGIDTDTSIKILFVIASILTGLSVSVAGIIGFVGLIIPQLIRLLIGSDYRILLIISFIAGGAFMVMCDTIARTIIAPNELPIGVITGFIGGIVFIIVLARTQSMSKISG